MLKRWDQYNTCATSQAGLIDVALLDSILFRVMKLSLPLGTGVVSGWVNAHNGLNVGEPDGNLAPGEP